MKASDPASDTTLKHTSVLLPGDLLEQLDKIARPRTLRRSDLIRQACRELIEKEARPKN